MAFAPVFFGGGSSESDEEIIALLESIKSKTDLLGSGTVVTSQPVSGLTIISPLMINDDYTTELGNAFEFNFTPPSGAEIEDITCAFGGVKVDSAGTTWLSVGTISDNEDGSFKATFELSESDTSVLTEGFYNWTVSITYESETRTIARGTRVRWVRRHTDSLLSV
jgi:hypothetical protein